MAAPGAGEEPKAGQGKPNDQRSGERPGENHVWEFLEEGSPQQCALCRGRIE